MPRDESVSIYRLLVLGNSDVGKSCLTLRFVEDTFSESTCPTVGVDFKCKKVDLDNDKVKLQVWDTAGVERYMSMSSNYYRGAHGAIIVYDVTNQDSFNNVRYWLDELEHHAGRDITILLVGNKCDLTDARVVDYETGKEFADQLGMYFQEASAKTAVNVDNIFMTMAAKIRETVESENAEAVHDAKMCIADAKPLAEKRAKCC